MHRFFGKKSFIQYSAQYGVLKDVDFFLRNFPEKLIDWVSIWLNLGKCRNFVCTVKFQENSHYGVIKKFGALPHTAFLCLSHNKHELTWMSLNVSSHN